MTKASTSHTPRRSRADRATATAVVRAQRAAGATIEAIVTALAAAGLPLRRSRVGELVRQVDLESRPQRGPATTPQELLKAERTLAHAEAVGAWRTAFMHVLGKLEDPKELAGALLEAQEEGRAMVARLLAALAIWAHAVRIEEEG